MNFEAYLISKKIDSDAFQKAEAAVWKTWQQEFEQIHPNSFTAQKLYLINPVRRQYPLKHEPPKPPVAAAVVTDPASTSVVTEPVAPTPAITAQPKPAVPRPVFKPKPKMT